MLDQRYRPLYQSAFLNPLLRLPIWKHVSPMQVTMLGCLMGIMILPLLAAGWNFLAIVALLISGFLDTLDGALARWRRLSSPQGAVLDIVCDRVVEFSIVLGLYWVDPAERGFLSLLMLGSILICVTTFLVMGIFTPNDSSKSFYYSPGLMERAEAFLFFAAMIGWPSGFAYLAGLFIILTCWTAGLRLYQFYNNYSSS